MSSYYFERCIRRAWVYSSRNSQDRGVGGGTPTVAR